MSKRLLTLSLLHEHAAGAYGSELVKQSDGALSRGSIYALLGRLEAEGLATSTEEPATSADALPRTRYRITDAGRRALNRQAAVGKLIGVMI